MRRRWTLVALALLVLAVKSACGSNATGISVAIDPDPVPASRLGDGSYTADWDAVVADLTGVGGTVQSIEAGVSGAASLTTPSSQAGASAPSVGVAVEPFARKLFHQSSQFTANSGQAVSVQVTVTFRGEDGQSYQSSAQARVTLR